MAAQKRKRRKIDPVRDKIDYNDYRKYVDEDQAYSTGLEEFEILPVTRRASYHFAATVTCPKCSHSFGLTREALQIPKFLLAIIKKAFTVLQTYVMMSGQWKVIMSLKVIRSWLNL